jgi:hypothetical protein
MRPCIKLRTISWAKFHYQQILDGLLSSLSGVIRATSATLENTGRPAGINERYERIVSGQRTKRPEAASQPNGMHGVSRPRG